MNYIILGQVLTLISYLIFWISRFCKNKHKLLLWDNISRIAAIAAFFFLGTYDGIKNTLFVIVRNIMGQVTNKKSITTKLLTFIIMSLILIGMYYIGFNGITTILVGICGIFNLFGVIMCKEQGIRLFGLLGSSFYAAFLLLTNNITGFICEIICFFVILTSYLKYRDKSHMFK